MDKRIIEKCKNIARLIRKDVIEMTWDTRAGHLGGSFSCVDTIASIYFSGILNFDINNLLDENRDRFLLSKSQASMVLYSALKHLGIVTEEDIKTYKTNDTFLYANLVKNEEKGIETSNGSLGQCLPFALGIALGLKIRKNLKPRVFALIGDGECNEGSIWEAALIAAQYKLDNLTVIVDKNGLQYDGYTEDILSLEPMDEKWKSFGWQVTNIDGNSIEENIDALEKRYEKPHVIIAKTIKGKGVSFTENNPDWHVGTLTKEQYEQAKQELEVQ